LLSIYDCCMHNWACKSETVRRKNLLREKEVSAIFPQSTRKRRKSITKHKTINISLLPESNIKEENFCCSYNPPLTAFDVGIYEEENVIIVWTTSGCKKHWNLLWKIIIRIHIANNIMTYSQFSYRRNTKKRRKRKRHAIRRARENRKGGKSPWNNK
jgi:hypothetical protein